MVPSVALRFTSGSTPDPRRYNEPSARDVAMVFTGSDPPSFRAATVYCRSADGCGDTHRMSTLNEHVDPLTYVLLCPYGEKGWCPDLKAATSGSVELTSKIQVSEFYARRLMVFESDRTSLPHAAGRLFQQYIVDAYIKREGMQLDWARRNQAKLRMDTYLNLTDYVSGGADDAMRAAPAVAEPAGVSPLAAWSPQCFHPLLIRHIPSKSLVAPLPRSGLLARGGGGPGGLS